ncbi:hypothetical protein Tco_0059080 [Tanacetum coccineum]
MEQMTSICDLVGQVIQKKEEEKRIAEEQAAKDRYWKIPICYDNDEDDTIGITPVLQIKEPNNSLSMGDEHLDTVSAIESDEFIKSSVEILVPILSESEGVYKMCDVPLCENTTPLNALNEHSKIVVNSNDDNSSSDDNSSYGDNIDYVDASPPDVEIVSLEVVEIIVPEVRRIDDDILLTIKDDTLHEKLLNVNLLIAKIDALRDNPTPSSDVMIKSTSTFSNLFLERLVVACSSNRSDLSLPDYRLSTWITILFKEKSSGSTTTHVDFSQYDSFIFDLSNDQFPLADRSDLYHEEFADELAHIMSLPNLEWRNRLMRSDELYKFSDGTLTRLLTLLKDITKNIHMEYLPKRRWSSLEKKRAHIMIKVINKLLKERRMLRSLEKFVGGRHYGTDLRLLQRII